MTGGSEGDEDGQWQGGHLDEGVEEVKGTGGAGRDWPGRTAHVPAASSLSARTPAPTRGSPRTPRTPAAAVARPPQ